MPSFDFRNRMRASLYHLVYIGPFEIRHQEGRELLASVSRTPAGGLDEMLGSSMGAEVLKEHHALGP